MEVWSARRSVNQVDLWTSLWEKTEIVRSVEAFEHGRDPVHALMERFLRMHGGTSVLDHGCGFGRISLYLEKRGWDVTGIDFSPLALRQLRDLDPSIPGAVADVRALPFAAETFDAVVSIGVVEHLPEGPELPLRELARVLRPSGLALITVPFQNPWRRLRTKLPGERARFRGPYRIERSDSLPGAVAVDESFYQFAFRLPEFTELLARSGLTVHQAVPYSYVRGLADASIGEKAHLFLRRRFGAGRDGAPSTDAPVQQGMSMRAHLRALYDESDSAGSSRFVKALAGPVFGHMMAYYVRRA